MRACECGCTDFIVRFRQIEEYDACIDADSEDVRWSGSNSDVISVDTIEEDGYTCENCGKHYDSLDDIPDDGEDDE